MDGEGVESNKFCTAPDKLVFERYLFTIGLYTIRLTTVFVLFILRNRIPNWGGVLSYCLENEMNISIV